MGCGNNKVSRSYLSSQPVTPRASDLVRVRADKPLPDVRRTDARKTAQAQRDQDREKAEKTATRQVRKANQNTPVAELEKLRRSIKDNADLSATKKQHLTRQLDRLITSRQEMQRRVEQIGNAAHEALEANTGYSSDEVDAIISSQNFQAGLRTAAEATALGFDSASPSGTGLVDSTRSVPGAEPKATGGTLGNRGSGRRGFVAEVATLGELSSRDVATADGNNNKLSLQIQESDQVILGEKFNPGSEKRKTVEGDITIHRDGLKIAIDSKYRSNGTLEQSQKLDKELEGVVEAIANGRIDHFVFTTNGPANDKARARINEANTRLQERLAQRRQELKDKYDSTVALHEQRSAQRDEHGNLYDKDGNLLDKEGWTSEQLSHYARLRDETYAPSITIVEGVGEFR